MADRKELKVLFAACPGPLFPDFEPPPFDAVALETGLLGEAPTLVLTAAPGSDEARQ